VPRVPSHFTRLQHTRSTPGRYRVFFVDTALTRLRHEPHHRVRHPAMSTLSGLAGVPGSRRSCCLRNHRVTKRVSHFVVRASTREGRTTHDDSANDTYTNNQTSPGEITELQNERIRAERMAVRVKLLSVVARGVGPKGPNAKNQRNKETPKAMTLDAAIVETKKSNAVGDGSFRNDSTRSSASNVSVSIDNERNAVRTRLERFSMTRYAFVERGDMKGRVVDRVTGHEAIDDDDDTKSNSLDDRVDLARERVKQAQQVLSHAVATANSAVRTSLVFPKSHDCLRVRD
jgi:hypothetical protein